MVAKQCITSNPVKHNAVNYLYNSLCSFAHDPVIKLSKSSCLVSYW